MLVMSIAEDATELFRLVSSNPTIVIPILVVDKIVLSVMMRSFSENNKISVVVVLVVLLFFDDEV